MQRKSEAERAGKTREGKQRDRGLGMYNGIINIYKEKDFTSHDVVAKLRGICGQRKIGHTGTLDPQAEGVLPVCLGNATRLCDLLTDWDKEYVAELLLGVCTDTQDTTGQVLERRPVTASEEEVRSVVLSFRGEYLQVPPMYSALKVNGKKLYELARAGKEVEREARPVTIREVEILEMNLPLVKLRVCCSKGTYIRTLCHDIGQKLCCGGAMASLVRTRVGIFAAAGAKTLSQVEALRDQGLLADWILPPDACFPGTAALHVKDAFVGLLENGNAFDVSQTVEEKAHAPGEWIRVYNEAGRFFAIYAYEPERKRYKPVKMFL